MPIRAPSPLPSLAHRPLSPTTCTRSHSRPCCVRSQSEGFLQGSRASGHWNEGSANRWRRVPVVPKATNPDTDLYKKESVKKRRVVEHVYLVKAKADLSDDEEKDMLDYLYTSQYQMRGILAISLGRITDLNVDGFTHAVFMRFQKKEDLMKFYTNSYYLGVLKDHVIPYCYVCPDMSRFLLIMKLK